MLSAISRWLPAPFEAKWLNPLLFSWVIERAALAPFVPEGLEVDCWRGDAYISLVGLRFESVRVLGVPAPVAGYDEVNLRFYVRRRFAGDDGHCPGVVFVRQMVPNRATALAARAMYGEPFMAVWVGHEFSPPETGFGAHPRRVAYQWDYGGRKRGFWAEVGDMAPTPASPGSLDEFLTAKYWGYNGKPGSPTRTYRLTRPEWRLCGVARWGVDCDAGEVYGEPFATVMREEPASVLLATGSRAAVGWPSRLSVEPMSGVG